jgi:hypothetical protein
VDRDRVFDGQYVDESLRLALLTPILHPPAWGPHVSVIRNEAPKKNRDLWLKAVEIGDMADELTRLSESSRFLREKAQRLHEAAEQAGKADDRERIHKQAEETLASAKSREHRIPRFRDDLWLARDRWDRVRSKAGLPEGIGPLNEVSVEIDVENVETSGHHWWFSVQSERIRTIREVFGLSPRIPLPPHMTFAVLEGTPEGNGFQTPVNMRSKGEDTNQCSTATAKTFP